MAEIAIAIVSSIYIIMKITERIIKDWSHKKTLKEQDFDKVVMIYDAQFKNADENFSAVVEEIKDLKSKYEEIKDLQLGAPKFGGRL